MENIACYLLLYDHWDNSVFHVTVILPFLGAEFSLSPIFHFQAIWTVLIFLLSSFLVSGTPYTPFVTTATCIMSNQITIIASHLLKRSTSTWDPVHGQ